MIPDAVIATGSASCALRVLYGIRGIVQPVVPCMDWESLSLPPGYRVADDADVLALRRADGSVVAHFMADYADPRLIESVAWEDYRGA